MNQDNPTYTVYDDIPMEKLVEAACDVLPFTGYDLDNDVHPILAQANFLGMAQGDYDALLPALRFLSQILSTDCFLRFWHVFLRGEERHVKNPEGPGYHMAYFPRRLKLTARDTKLVKLDLLNLAKVVQFQPNDFGDGVCEASGQTHPDTKVKLRARTRDAPGKVASIFSGHPSKVLYDQGIHDGICDLYRKAQDQGQVDFGAQLLGRYFCLANTLLHELAHVADYARHGVKLLETPLEHNTVAEAGFDVQDAIFGGILAWDSDLGFMTMEEWSNPVLEAHYMTLKSSGMWFGQESEDVFSKVWRIPDAWIQQLFQRDFWTQVVPALGADALKAPRLLGFRFVMPECGCESPGTSPEDDEHVERQHSADCCFGVADRVIPPFECSECDLHGKYALEVPEGYVLWRDGTLVLEELCELVREMEDGMSS